MEAPEYLDLDEIDFSDDSVVSVIQRPFHKRPLRAFFQRLGASSKLITQLSTIISAQLRHLSLTLFSCPEVFCDIPEKHPRVVQEERWPGRGETRYFDC